MSQWNVAAKSQEERDKVNVDLAASGGAYKERLNMPVVLRPYCASSRKSTSSTSWRDCGSIVS